MLPEVVCPANCAAALPPVSFDKCAPDARVAEITHFLVGAANAAPLANVTDAAEWATRLDNAAAGDKIRTLVVRANKPATTKTTQTLTNNRQVVTNRHHVINFTIDEMNDANYDFIRTTQCGIIQFKLWWINNNTKDLFGGDAGVTVTIFGEAIYEEGTGVLQKFVGTAEWDSMQDPQRDVNPIAGL